MTKAIAYLLLAAMANANPITASWYGESHRGQPMANGRPFDPDGLTCASWFWPLGTVLVVEAAGTGRRVIVVVTDKGPAPRLVRQGRQIDLSRRAFELLGPLRDGLMLVEVRPYLSRRVDRN